VQRTQGMAGYRNRLVHGYADVTPEEIYDLLTRHLMDFAEFTKSAVKPLASAMGI